MNTDILIVGSGFAACTLANLLEANGLNFIILDISEEQKVNIKVIDSSIFDLSQAQKTKSVFGGIKVWGKCITLPNHTNFFSRGENSWLAVGEELKKININEFFPKLTIDSSELSKRILRKLSRNFPFLQMKFIFERHGYALATSKSEGFLSWKGEILQGGIRKIGIDDEAHTYIEFKRETQVHKIYYKSIVFASGAIGNALLVNRFTKQKSFRFGNHVSSTFGTFSFKRPCNLNKIFQSFRDNEKEFVTFCLNPVSRRCQAAIRIIPVRKKSLAELWRGQLVISNLKFTNVNFWIQIKHLTLDTTYRLVFGRRLDQEYNIRVLAELPLTIDSYLEIKSQDERAAQIEIKSCVSKEVLEEVRNVLTEFANVVQSSSTHIKREVSLNNLERAIWSDSGHYFGTVPVSSELGFAAVDENLLLRGQHQIYVLGNSAHAVGSHGHPTALTVLLAARLAKHLKDKPHV